MNDYEILKNIKKYFGIKELVGWQTCAKYGENSWQFLDIRLLQALLIVREGLKKEIYVNNWIKGGNFSERGLRSNVQNIVKSNTMSNNLYLSAHVMGKAVDFDVKGMSAEDVRNWIKENAHLFPFKIRLEHIDTSTNKPINWVHMDVIQNVKNPQIYLFNV